MSGDVREYGHNVLMQAIGRILSIVGGSVVFIAATHMVSVENVASYALALTLLGFIWTMADLGTTATLGVRIAEDSERRGETLGLFLMMRLGLATVAGLLGAVACLFILPAPMHPVMLVACALTPVLAARFYEPVFQVARRPGLSGVLGITYTTALILLAGAALILAPERADLLVAANVAAGTLNGLLGLWLIHRLVGIRWDRLAGEPMLALLSHALPVGASSLIAMLNLRSGTLLLNFISGPEAVANFAAAQRFLDLGVAAVITAMTPLLAIFGRIARTQSGTEVAGRVLSTTLWAVAPVPLLAWFWSAPVVGFLYGPDLRASGDILPVVALQFSQFALGTALTPWLLASLAPKELRVLIWGPAVSLAASLTLSTLLIRPLGAMGAAIAAATAETVLAGILMLLFQRKSGLVPAPGPLLALGGALVMMAAALALPPWPLAARTALAVALYGLVILAVLPGFGDVRARTAMRAWLRERLP